MGVAYFKEQSQNLPIVTEEIKYLSGQQVPGQISNLKTPK